MIKIKYVPNLLTIIRILIVPFYVWLTFVVNSVFSLKLAFFLFVIASFTDYLDGYLARKYNVITNFGKIMDPLADKILVICALAAMAWTKLSYINWWIFGIIVFREFAVTILREIYIKKGIYIAANIWGKVKTVMQMTGIIFVLFYHSFLRYNFSEAFDNNIHSLFLVYFWITAVVTILSGANYFFVKRKTEKK